MKAVRGAVYGLLAFMSVAAIFAAAFAAGAYYGTDALWVIALCTGVAFVCLGILVEIEEHLT